MPQVWVQFRSLFVPFNSCTHMHTQKKIVITLKYRVQFWNGIDSFCVTQYDYWSTTVVSSRPGIPRGECVAGHKVFEGGVLAWCFVLFVCFFPRKWNLWIALNSVGFILFIHWHTLTLKLAPHWGTGELTGSRCQLWFYNCKKTAVQWFETQCLVKQNLTANTWSEPVRFKWACWKERKRFGPSGKG